MISAIEFEMNRVPIAWIIRIGFAGTLLVGACGGSGGGDPSNPDERAPVDTLAYIVTECRIADDTVDVHQELRIQRGEGVPLTVAELDVGPLDGSLRVLFPFSSVPPQEVDLSTACRRLGQIRLGSHSVFFFYLQDVAVSPDGSGIVFEITDNFSPLPPGLLPADRRGIFFVRADGSGLRRIGDARTEPSFVLEAAVNVRAFAFSPDGRSVTFIDHGPGPDGELSPQVVVVDLRDDRRRTLTRLPAGPPATRFPSTCCASFVDGDTLSFSSTSNPVGLNPRGEFLLFTIERDGTGLSTVDPLRTSGDVVSPLFAIPGAQPGVAILEVSVPGARPVPEVFFFDEEKNVLQLTALGKPDTISALLGTDRATVFFPASADPVGLNPSGNCQIFAIPTVGGSTRQLTDFRETEVSTFGCLFSPARGCAIGSVFQDPYNDTLVFHSSCDPLGTNPFGDQVFAMRTDGTGLRQLTDTRGMSNENGIEIVELPGPFSYRMSPVL